MPLHLWPCAENGARKRRIPLHSWPCAEKRRSKQPNHAPFVALCGETRQLPQLRGPGPPQAGILAVSLDQFLMAAELCDPAVDHDRDPVGIVCSV
jgi:hypothetical protein